MARKRMIDPDFWVDERIGTLSRDARLLFIGMWNFADDQGRMSAAVARLKAEVFPYDNDLSVTAVTALLQELVSAELVKPYAVDGRDLLWIPNFLKHQKINHPTASTLPPYTESVVTTTVGLPEDSGSTPSHVMVRQPNYGTSAQSNGDGQKRTPLQLLDSLMPGRINAATSQWLTDLVADYGEDEVRVVLHIAASKEPKPTQPKAYIAKVIADRAKERATGNDPDEDPDTRDIRRLREERKRNPPPDPNEPFYIGPEMRAKLEAQAHAN